MTVSETAFSDELSNALPTLDEIKTRNNADSSPSRSLALDGPGSVSTLSLDSISGGYAGDSSSPPDSQSEEDVSSSEDQPDQVYNPARKYESQQRACDPTLEEFSRIREACPVLRPTGCTADFCQAGRMIKTNEPRVGRDKPLSEVRTDAFDFLRQLRRDGILESDEHLRLRAQDVILQTERNPEVVKKKRNSINGDKAAVGGPWYQTFRELEHGVRLAWKNSPKCIMRSEYQSLKLVGWFSSVSKRDN